jgi:hypothetical protein
MTEENVRAKLAPLFDAPHLGEDARESLLSTLDDIPADELVEQLDRTVHVLDGLTTAAEEIDLATYCVLSEAQEKARAMLAQFEND